MTRVPDNDEPVISYAAVTPGIPVLTSDRAEIGTLEHVLEVPDLDLFDGIVIATSDGLRFIDADQIEAITAAYIRTSLDQSQAKLLPPPGGPPVYRVNALEDVGDSMHDRLGRLFRRPHWVRE
jgi:hypothetical protein